jgi:hypothetical protein
MTYTLLTTNELVMIEAYYQEKVKVSDIVTSLGSSSTLSVMERLFTKIKRKLLYYLDI